MRARRIDEWLGRVGTGQVVENMRMWAVGCWPQNAMFGKNRLTLGSLSVSRSVLAHTFTFISLQNKVTPRAHVRRQRQPWWCCLSIFLFVELHTRIHILLLRNIFWPTKDQGFTLVCFYFSNWVVQIGLLVRWAQYWHRKVPNMDVVWKFEKKHVCEYCGKNFLQKSAWRDHVKSWHTEDKPYRCCKCNYSSVDATALRTHMKTCIQHEFLCPVRPLCNYSFSSSNALEKHIIMHTGNVSLFQKQWILKCNNYFPGEFDFVPYKCDICHLGFSHKPSMKIHKIAEHSVHKTYVCEFKFKRLKCPVTSGSKYDMLEHIKIHHDPMKTKGAGRSTN